MIGHIDNILTGFVSGYPLDRLDLTTPLTTLTLLINLTPVFPDVFSLNVSITLNFLPALKNP
ncbi:hypothetical protein [Photorhabdus tasmaniensis]|jgi:hypothetical protein|uniref:Uncharacterized protein n=1 Tax=Photorhabdus tasmaniensis TaxID=1004159 RepID=A0ABX0GD88_9GAMM|nr:hypothetical protein [Photorhabdus tasmaniensis]NHB87019.1 hypothetical protein [Photorhabdus tasmaniensis]